MEQQKKQIAISVIVLTALVSAFFFCLHRDKKPVLYGDALGYYLYLPSTFIYHNFYSQDSLPANRDIPSDVTWYVAQHRADPVSPKGYHLNQYTYGIALMEAPFFLVAHAYAAITGTDSNGFTGVYLLMLWVSTWFYVLLGCILTYRILCRFSPPLTALCTVCLIFLGSNLFWFTWIQPGMAHTSLFFLYAALSWLSIRIREYPSKSRFIAMGFCIGLITLIRPTDIICVLIPLCYQVYDMASAREKVRFLWTHRSGVLLLILVAAVPMIPQLIYWKLLSGTYLYYSYGDQKFYWKSPKILEGLFYAKNGWLAYSPLFFGSLAGLFLLRRYRDFAWAIWLLLPLYIYIIYSWYCYNYINGFGSRPMIHLYPLLAIPMAVLLQRIAESRAWIKGICGLLILAAVYVNLNLSTRQVKGQLVSDNSYFNYNLQLLFRNHLGYNQFVSRDNGIRQPDPGQVQFLKTLQCLDYEDSLSGQYLPDPVRESGYVYGVRQGEPYPPSTIEIVYTPEVFGKARWIRCKGRFCASGESGGGTAQVLVLGIYRGDTNLEWASCTIGNKIGIAGDREKEREFSQDKAITGTWGEVYFYMPVPGNIRAGDKISFLVWNIAERPLLMDDLCLELYQ